MSETNKNELKDILNKMDRINEVFSYEVWIPSLKRNVMFREINTSQQKRLVKAIIDSPVHNTQFIFTLRQIIKENCAENIDIDELTVFDKMCIAIKMREVCIGDVVELAIDEKNKRGISLKDVHEKLLTVELPSNKTFSDEKGIYTVECSVPTIGAEYGLESELRNNKDVDIEVDTPDKMRELIGDSFIEELIKHVSTISYKEDEENIVKIQFSKLGFADRVALLERIPTKIISDVILFANNVTTELNKVLLYKFEIQRDGKPEIVEARMSINSSFFTIS